MQIKYFLWLLVATSALANDFDILKCRATPWDGAAKGLKAASLQNRFSFLLSELSTTAKKEIYEPLTSATIEATKDEDFKMYIRTLAWGAKDGPMKLEGMCELFREAGKSVDENQRRQVKKKK